MADGFTIRRNQCDKLDHGTWERLRVVLSCRMQDFAANRSNHLPLIQETIQSMEIDEEAIQVLHEKWAAFIQLPYTLRFLLEAGGYMDSIPLDQLRKIRCTPEADLGRELDDQAASARRSGPIRSRRSGEKRSCDDRDYESKLLGSRIADRTAVPSKFLREILKSNGMRWDDEKGEWEQLMEPFDEKGQVRQSRLDFLGKGEVSPKYFSTKESNILQRSQYLGTADRWLELQLHQPFGDSNDHGIKELVKKINGMVHGFVFCGRFYELWSYKFERDGKYPRFFFFATMSFGHALPDLPNIRLSENNVLFASRDLLGKSCRFIPEPKICPRLELLLSKTYEVPLLEGTRILYSDDLYGNNRPQLGDSLSLMTDGAGLCSMDIAMRVPLVSSGSVSEGERRTRPSIMQVRIVDDRSSCPIIIKGCLVPTLSLPNNTIIVTRSMVKAPSPDNGYTYGSGQCLNAFLSRRPLDTLSLLGIQAYDLKTDLKVGPKLFKGPVSISLGVTTTTWTFNSPARLGRHPLLLLDREREDAVKSDSKPPRPAANRAVRDVFKKLMQEEAKELKGYKGSVDEAVRMANRVGGPLGDKVLQFIASGCHERVDEDGRLKPGFNPCIYLMNQLNELGKSRIEQLSAMKLETPDTGRGIGVPDFSQSIPYGCIVVIGRDNRPLWGGVEQRRVLVYRDPCLGERELAAALCVPPTRRFYETYGASPASAVYFSVLGEISIAMQLATGDFDGDEYLVIAHKDIVENFEPHPKSDFPIVRLRALKAGSSQPQSVQAAKPALSLPPTTPSISRMSTRSSSQDQKTVSTVAPLSAPPPPPSVALLSAPPLSSEPKQVKEYPRGSITGIVVDAVVRELKAQNIVGQSSVRWEAWADANGPGCPECLKLAKVYADSLDAVKSGDEILDLKELPGEIPISRQGSPGNSKPVWRQMEATGSFKKHSGQISICEELFLLFAEDYDNQRQEPPFWSDRSLFDPDADLGIAGSSFHKLCKKNRDLFNSYNDEWERKKRQWGWDWRAAMQSPNKGQGSVSKLKAVKKDRSQAIISAHREYLWEGTEPCTVTGIYASYQTLYWKAMTLYSVCYREADNRAENLLKMADKDMKKETSSQPSVNFAWIIAGEVLMFLKASKRAVRRGDSAIPPVFCRGSGLRTRYRYGSGKDAVVAVDECEFQEELEGEEDDEMEIDDVM